MMDNSRLFHEMTVHVATLAPEIDEKELATRLESILANYNVKRKTTEQVEDDMHDKIVMFLSAKELEGFTDDSLSSYSYNLRQFARFCKKATVQVTTQDVRDYLASFSHLKKSSIVTKLNTINSFFDWLVKEELLLRSPSKKIPIPKTQKRNPKGLTIAELEHVRESCATLRQRALLEVFYSTGCRLSELRRIDINSIDFQTMSLSVIGKGNKERVVYLSSKALYYLEKYLNSRNDDCEALFVTVRRPIRRMSKGAIQDEINKIETAAQLTKKLTPHVLRHTFANLSMDAGIELADLQHLMGHSSPGTTLIYTQVSEERKRSAHKKYHVQ